VGAGDDDSAGRDGGAGRIEIVLHRPRLPWHPRPTVVVAGRGQPAQWGTGTWQLSPGAPIGVYLYNRAWRYGAAELTLPTGTRILHYRPPRLPFGPGRLTPA
jgi:hypothetical protein